VGVVKRERAAHKTIRDVRYRLRGEFIGPRFVQQGTGVKRWAAEIALVADNRIE
jgi:hypothetical protein